MAHFEDLCREGEILEDSSVSWLQTGVTDQSASSSCWNSGKSNQTICEHLEDDKGMSNKQTWQKKYCLSNTSILYGSIAVVGTEGALAVVHLHFREDFVTPHVTLFISKLRKLGWNEWCRTGWRIIFRVNLSLSECREVYVEFWQGSALTLGHCNVCFNELNHRVGNVFTELSDNRKPG